MLVSFFIHVAHETVAIPAEIIFLLQHFWQMMLSGSAGNTCVSGHGGGVGGLGEVSGDCTRPEPLA
jgi:hypothetical protein